jgi:hypothetical protein
MGFHRGRMTFSKIVFPIFLLGFSCLAFGFNSDVFAQEERKPEIFDWLAFRTHFLFVGYTSAAYAGEFVKSGGFSWNPAFFRAIGFPRSFGSEPT